MKQKAKIKLIKKDPCPYCDRAMTFFRNKGFEVEVVDLTNNLEELRSWKEKTGCQTVPMIFVNDVLIGGYRDIKALDDEGKLDPMILGS